MYQRPNISSWLRKIDYFYVQTELIAIGSASDIQTVMHIYLYKTNLEPDARATTTVISLNRWRFVARVTLMVTEKISWPKI